MDARTVTAVVFLVLGSLACSAPPAPGPATGGDQRPATQQEPKRGGTLVFAASKDMTTDHPYNQNLSTNAFINDTMYEPLVMYDLKGKLHGMLAEKWEASPDAKEWIFTLRKGVKFHDGREMTAADVVFSVNHILEPTNASYGNSAMTADVEKVEAMDSHRVKFIMKGPRGLFPHVVSDVSRIGVIPANSLNPGPKLEGPRPPGTGPFKFEGWKPKEETVVSRFDGYWGGAPYLDKIVFKVVANEQARGNALRAGDVHIAERIPIDLVQRAQKGEVPGVKVEPAGTSGARVLILNHKGRWFADRRMREAFALSLDRDAIMEEAFYGFGTPMEFNVPKGSDWEQAMNLSLRKRDVAKARSLAKESGYAGESLTILATRGQDEGVSESVSRMAREAGINIEIRSLENTVWRDSAQKGDFDILVGSQAGEVEPGLDFNDQLRCEKGELRRANRAAYCNPQVDQLFDRYVTEPDRTKRLGMWGQIARILYDDVVQVTLGWTNSRFFGWTEKVHDFQQPGNGAYTHATGGLKRTWLEQ